MRLLCLERSRAIAGGRYLGGSEGVNSVVHQLNKELTINMMLGGAKTIEEVKNIRLYADEDFE
ncbi:alpha-hydroxy-acid oxidizing protein [Ensifer adhaerens]|uniref:alpha-hydroxy-acid oxidizing protein n=1 Tax=Ensifer adhaerens TaxID=106592 RepID=UPI0018F7E9B1|nr:alpha-hydroxy-acid oxidizing protein [Ensifer adhaerens]